MTTSACGHAQEVARILALPGQFEAVGFIGVTEQPVYFRAVVLDQQPVPALLLCAPELGSWQGCLCQVWG